jgi:hypothetical protein
VADNRDIKEAEDRGISERPSAPALTDSSYEQDASTTPAWSLPAGTVKFSVSHAAKESVPFI